jgi:hypothetical protein
MTKFNSHSFPFYNVLVWQQESAKSAEPIQGTEKAQNYICLLSIPSPQPSVLH